MKFNLESFMPKLVDLAAFKVDLCIKPDTGASKVRASVPLCCVPLCECERVYLFMCLRLCVCASVLSDSGAINCVRACCLTLSLPVDAVSLLVPTLVLPSRLQISSLPPYHPSRTFVYSLTHSYSSPKPHPFSPLISSLNLCISLPLSPSLSSLLSLALPPSSRSLPLPPHPPSPVLHTQTRLSLSPPPPTCASHTQNTYNASSSSSCINYARSHDVQTSALAHRLWRCTSCWCREIDRLINR